MERTETRLFITANHTSDLNTLVIRALERELAHDTGGHTKTYGEGMWRTPEDKKPMREPTVIYSIIHAGEHEALQAIGFFVREMKRVLYQEAILRVDTQVNAELM